MKHIPKICFCLLLCTSPSIEESVLQNAIMHAIINIAKQSGDVLEMLKIHIGMGITDTQNEDNRLELLCKAEDKRGNAESRLDEICTILAGLENHPMTYDDQIVRQILEIVVVVSKDQIKVIFPGGMEVTQPLE